MPDAVLAPLHANVPCQCPLSARSLSNAVPARVCGGVCASNTPLGPAHRRTKLSSLVFIVSSPTRDRRAENLQPAYGLGRVRADRCRRAVSKLGGMSLWRRSLIPHHAHS